MRASTTVLLLPLVLLLPGGTAHAQQWFALTSRDTAATLVEVDLGTVRLRDGSGEAVIRVTHDVLQPHTAGFGYRSFVATAQIDCRRQDVNLISAAYYALPAGEGLRVGADSAGRMRGMPARLLQAIPQRATQALLKAACPAATP